MIHHSMHENVDRNHYMNILQKEREEWQVKDGEVIDNLTFKNCKTIEQKEPG